LSFSFLAFLLSSQVQTSRLLYRVRAVFWDERLQSFLVLEGIVARDFLGPLICVGIIALPDR